MMNKKIKLNLKYKYLGILMLIVAFALLLKELSYAKTYDDVKVTGWYYNAINYVTEKEIFSGVSTVRNIFDPQGKMTRAMIVNVLYSMEGKPSIKTQTTKYTDVYATNWYFNAVNWASDNKIVTGFPDNTFRPNENVTREMFAVVFKNYMVMKDETLKNYDVTNVNMTDSKDFNSASTWSKDAIKFCVGNEILQGDTNKNINPKNSLTRAETATVIMKLDNKIKNEISKENVPQEEKKEELVQPTLEPEKQEKIDKEEIKVTPESPKEQPKVEEKKDDTKKFNTVQDMKTTSDLKSGEKVRTLGYNTKGDNGSALYVISDKEESTSDDFLTIKLNNNLYANRQIENDTVNVASYGIKAGDDIGAKLNYMSKALLGKAKTIEFNAETYYVGEIVNLQSLTYKGNNTRIEVINNFRTNTDCIFQTKGGLGILYDINLLNITFICEATSNLTLKDREFILVSLQDIKQSTVDNCTFIAKPADEDGIYTKLSLLWYRSSDTIKNVVVKNSAFECLTGEAHGDGTLVGGCIWASGKSVATSNISNFRIENCEFETTVADEVLGFWKANTKDVTISNCTIKNHANESDNFITFLNGTFENVLLDKVDIDVEVPVAYALKFVQLASSSDITCRNCTINYNYEGKNKFAAPSMFIVTSLDGADDYSDIIIDNCDIKLNENENTKYFSLMSVKDSKKINVKIKDSNIDGNFSAGLLFSTNSNEIKLDCIGNEIDTKGNIVSQNKSFSNTITLEDNTIASRWTCLLTDDGNVEYVLSNNTFTGDNLNCLIIAQNISNVSNKSSIKMKNNIIKEGASHHIFYTNTSIKQEDILTLIEE